MSGEDPLRAYVERLLALRAPGDEAPDPATLRALAEELGLDEETVARAAAEHAARGREFLRHGLLDDAVRELGEAAALQPADLEAVVALGRAHAARWRRTGREDDRAAAETLARRCVSRSPGFTPAYALLRELRTRPRSRMVLLGLAAAVALGLAAALLARGGRTAPPPGAPVAAGSPAANPAAAGSPAAAGPPAASSGAGGADPAVQAAAPDEQTLPVRADFDPALSWQPSLSRLVNYDERSYLTVEGLVRNQGRDLVTEAAYTLQVLDAAGNVLATDARKAPSLLDPAMRPGDTWPFRALVPTDARAATVRLAARPGATRPAPAAFVPARPLAVGWAVAQPPGLDVHASEREASSSENTLSGGYFHRVTLEVAHTGAAPLDELRLEIRRFGADDAAVEVETLNVAGGVFAPRLLPGERRVVRETYSGPAPIARYELRVAGVRVAADPPGTAAAR